MKNFLDILTSCPLFDGISPQELETMLSCLDARAAQYKKGETVLQEGDPAAGLGILLSGSVQVVRMDYYGNRSIIAKLGPADIFAEAFACADLPAMPVSVIAAENAQALLIEARRITETCHNACSFHNRLVHNLLRVLAAKNIACNRKIEITSKRSTREKLMTFLLMQAKNSGSSFRIPYDRQELADYLEVDRSGLSAEISKLRREGVILCRKNEFTLL